MAGVKGAGIRDEVLWSTWRDRLERDREQNGHYSCGLLLGVATKFGKDTRTIRRWLAAALTRRPQFELEEEHLAYIRLTNGNIGEAHRQLVKASKVDVSEKTFRRAFNRLPTGIREGLTKGKSALKAHLPYVTLPEPSAPNEIWEIDHGLLADIVVRDPHTGRRGHPWLTVVIDVHTRVVVGFAITLALRKDDGRRGAAIAESAFAALADAMLGRDYGGIFVGGRPIAVRFDQGSDFMNPVADALDRLGVATDPVEAETPQHKPYVERLIGTIKHKYLPTLPGLGITFEEAA